MGKYLLTMLLLLLAACTAPSHKQMQERLQYVSDCNRADTVFTERWLPTVDSLVSYFDRHGSANDRMMAHYVQGRVYHDMGEAPQALECYQRAAEQADTTRADCDYHQLARVYYQMNILFSDQDLPHQTLACLEKAERYAWFDHDTIMAIDMFSQRASAYELMNRQDSALLINEETIRRLRRYGLNDYAAIIEGYRFSILVDQKRYDEAAAPMKCYEEQSGLFHQGEIEPGREIYYYSKGLYYLGTGHPDSAEYYFRKEMATATDTNDSLGAFRGLSLTYQSLGNADSTAKYALLSYELRDSATSMTSAENLLHTQAMFDHERSVRKIEQKVHEARVSHLVAWLLAVVLVTILLLMLYLYRRYLEYRQKKQSELAALYNAFTTAQHHYQKTLDDLALSQSEYQTFQQQKQQEVNLLQQQLKQYGDQLLILNVDEKLQVIRESDTVKAMTDAARGRRGCHQPTTADWQQLETMVAQLIPPFYTAITAEGLLSPQELRTTILTLLGFTSGDISVLLEISAQSVTNTKSRSNAKLNGRKDASSFASNLHHLLRQYCSTFDSENQNLL